MWNFIINPLTNQKVNIYSNIGKAILQKYQQLSGGNDNESTSPSPNNKIKNNQNNKIKNKTNQMKNNEIENNKKIHNEKIQKFENNNKTNQKIQNKKIRNKKIKNNSKIPIETKRKMNRKKFKIKLASSLKHKKTTCKKTSCKKTTCKKTVVKTPQFHQTIRIHRISLDWKINRNLIKTMRYLKPGSTKRGDSIEEILTGISISPEPYEIQIPFDLVKKISIPILIDFCEKRKHNSSLQLNNFLNKKHYKNELSTELPSTSSLETSRENDNSIKRKRETVFKEERVKILNPNFLKFIGNVMITSAYKDNTTYKIFQFERKNDDKFDTGNLVFNRQFLSYNQQRNILNDNIGENMYKWLSNANSSSDHTNDIYILSDLDSYENEIHDAINFNSFLEFISDYVKANFEILDELTQS